MRCFGLCLFISICSFFFCLESVPILMIIGSRLCQVVDESKFECVHGACTIVVSSPDPTQEERVW